ncbi:copper-(or silver)-translocating P-type ATPase/heavy metal-(Cd/Co/Hg/Pb/Zn)-translocating P-type ATPase [Chelatococcus sambhunathii]|uniref:Nitrogen fixation protein FixI n=2 Tax=Chelatococcus TaxID=28209 RepID=A0AAC9NXZ4_9HYPH|nr:MULTISPECIES: heavy metal translocating P-type ATPase [Chelatococcus]APF36485.1 nitrogen fixation protein FixI [Chelatococcus daeguensis]CUA89577.1 copper-(or silver)-translocating P-type ATPase/heavy metal-(Cd/Co/Hg/Pb/Zn)-translocating P-type ATPase [Chelatococcus sambhunathii]
MSCCGPATLALAAAPAAAEGGPSREEIVLASHRIGEGLWQTDLSVPAVHCGACMRTVENALGRIDGVEGARVNLSTRRVSVRWREAADPSAFVPTLAAIGYPAHLDDPAADERDETLSSLVRALAVAGFGAMNIMLMSVAVWSGAEAGARDLFHLISAAIALPTIAYSGRVFFSSAWNALSHGRTNMDVPISIGILIAFGMSLYDTVNSGAHAYFDAAVSLIFFLLIGRTLDHVMRERARTAVKGLARFAARGAHVVRGDGRQEYLPLSEIAPGMTLMVAAGERIPVDGEIIAGQSDIDCSLVNGESLPREAGPGTAVEAGTLNLTGPVTMRARAAAKDSFLAEMLRLMEAAEGGRSRYRRLADRAASLYAPFVHAAALVTFLGWMLVGGGWHQSLTVAVAVLIITCPCALALAVPMVQVVAARRLFEAGIMVKDGGALERITEIDTVVFDKTGTLTQGILALTNAGDIAPAELAVAAAIAAHSRHPHARAIAAAAQDRVRLAPVFDSVGEHPGLGLEATAGGHVYRLGRAAWALRDASGITGTVLSRNGRLVAGFSFADRLRPGAQQAVRALKAEGLRIVLLSGDRSDEVLRLAAELGITECAGDLVPGDKVAILAALAADGRKVLMVGDGLNDAPALAAAHASMAPATAADIGRNAADFVFLRDGLEAVPAALGLSRAAQALTRQNLALALIYNAIALPFAVFGFVTPLFAAVAMSSSSVIVVANALRLGRADGGAREAGRRVGRMSEARA